MNTSPTVKTFVLATALALGLGVTARADVEQPAAKPAPAPTVANLSLLGQSYATLTYSYIDLEGTSTHADGYKFEVNEPLAFGLDGILSYDYDQSGVVAGARTRQNVLGAALRAFSTSYNWGKPYVEVGGGYTWARAAGTKDNSFIWHAAVGAEFQVTPRATVTPYVRYEDAPDLAGGNTWSGGVKGSYWIDSSWAVTAGLERNDNHNTAFTVGTNFRF
jgi:hypothetical protein